MAATSALDLQPGYSTTYRVGAHWIDAIGAAITVMHRLQPERRTVGEGSSAGDAPPLVITSAPAGGDRGGGPVSPEDPGATASAVWTACARQTDAHSSRGRSPLDVGIPAFRRRFRIPAVRQAAHEGVGRAVTRLVTRNRGMPADLRKGRPRFLTVCWLRKRTPMVPLTCANSKGRRSTIRPAKACR